MENDRSVSADTVNTGSAIPVESHIVETSEVSDEEIRSLVTSAVTAVEGVAALLTVSSAPWAKWRAGEDGARVRLNRHVDAGDLKIEVRIAMEVDAVATRVLAEVERAVTGALLHATAATPSVTATVAAIDRADTV